MAFVDYFPKQLVVDPSTGQPVPGAQMELYAITDTGFTSPLSVVDMLDLPISVLTAGPTGITPDFKCPGRRQLLAKSGDLVTPLFSLAIAFEMLPDPSTAPDDQVLSTEDGQFVLLPMPGGGEGIGGAREYLGHASASLAPNANETGFVNLGWTYELIQVQADGACRVRLYDTAAHRDADLARPFGVNPTGDHGLMWDATFDAAGEATIVGPRTFASLSGSAVPITITNLAGTNRAVELSFLYRRTE